MDDINVEDHSVGVKITKEWRGEEYTLILHEKEIPMVVSAIINETIE